MSRFRNNISIVALTIALIGSPVAGFSADASPAYTNQVKALIIGKVVYPRVAKLKQQEGEPGIAVTIAASGAVSAATVETPSGVQSLDDAAIKAAQDAAPYPAPPEAGVVVHVKVKFVSGD